MRVYQFNLPVYDNMGSSLMNEVRAWEVGAVALAGGFTLLDGRGAWKDGEIQREEMRVYQVMCEQETFEQLLADAFRLFRDQKALFTISLGDGAVYHRTEWATEMASRKALGPL